MLTAANVLKRKQILDVRTIFMDHVAGDNTFGSGCVFVSGTQSKCLCDTLVQQSGFTR